MCFWCSVGHVFRVLAASSVVVTFTYSVFLFCHVSLSLFLLCLTEFMFISEEILSGVNTCGLQLCFSFPRSRPKQPSRPVFSLCVCVCVCVCVCSYLKVIVSHTASFQPGFSFVSLLVLFSVPLSPPDTLTLQAADLSLDRWGRSACYAWLLARFGFSRASCVFVASFFVSDNTKCLFVLLLCDHWEPLQRPTVLFWCSFDESWNMLSVEHPADWALNWTLCLDCFDWT